MLLEFTEKCAALLPGNRVEICSADAEALGVGNYDRVLVRSGDAGYICAVRVKTTPCAAHSAPPKKCTKVFSANGEKRK